MEQLRKKYQSDADLMSSKSRFGYFSILPSHTAAKTDFNKKIPLKTSDGRVTTQSRNIFSGTTSSGVLKKTYFSVPKSIYHNDPYDKFKQVNKKHSLKKQTQKQIFKPALLNKTLATPSYKYMSQNPPPKDPKCNRREDGSVIVKQRNICSNPLSKINQQKNKKFKYMESDYDLQKVIKNQQLKKNIQKRIGQGPFRAGNPVKQFLRNNIETFNDHEIKPQTKKDFGRFKSMTHDEAFRPNCKSQTHLFSYPQHLSDYVVKLQKKSIKKQQPLKLSNKKQSSKPSPSIAYSRINLLRDMR